MTEIDDAAVRDDSEGPEDLLFSDTVPADPGWAAASDVDDDWAPPAEDLPAARVVGAGAGFGFGEPVHRNPLPAIDAEPTAEPAERSESTRSGAQLEGLLMLGEDVEAVASVPAALVSESRKPAVVVCRPSARRVGARPAGFVVPSAVLFAGAGIGGYLWVVGGSHITAVIAVALSVVGSLFLWVMLRD